MEARPRFGWTLEVGITHAVFHATRDNGAVCELPASVGLESLRTLSSWRCPKRNRSSHGGDPCVARTKWSPIGTLPRRQYDLPNRRNSQEVSRHFCRSLAGTCGRARDSERYLGATH